MEGRGRRLVPTNMVSLRATRRTRANWGATVPDLALGGDADARPALPLPRKPALRVDSRTV